jgi:hypothetical protein
MKTLSLIGLLLVTPVAIVMADGCGDGGDSCGPDTKCCENVIAMFSGDAPAAPSFVQGRCVPKEQKCSDFWCGNRHCDGGFFGAPSVCCVNQPAGQAAQYTCAHSELSCPGNTTQLSIRNSQPDRKLQGT